MAVKTVAKRASKPKKATRRVARRTKRVTKKSQPGSYRRVWSGTAMYTKGGLMKKDLCINKRGKVVSRRMMLHGRRALKGLRGWLAATKAARKQLGIKGFVLCKKGTQYYRVAKAIYRK